MTLTDLIVAFEGGDLSMSAVLPLFSEIAKEDGLADTLGHNYPKVLDRLRAQGMISEEGELTDDGKALIRIIEKKERTAAR